MKKGFTLIELLAVILILGIIALIAIPTVNNILKEARYGTFSNTLSNIEKAVENDCALSQIKNKDITSKYIIVNGIISPNIEIKGELPNGVINVNDDCDITFTLSNNNFKANKEYNNDFVINDINKNIYKDPILNGADPELDTGMIPIYFDNNVPKVANIEEEWYNYTNKIWANAVTVKEEKRSYYQTVDSGTIVNEDDIVGYFVWIPRFAYKIQCLESGGCTNPQTFDIVFQSKNKKSNNASVGSHYTMPAFTLGDKELNGLWIGKFETTGTVSNPTIKPNVKISNSPNIATSYYSLANYDFGNINMTRVSKFSEISTAILLSYSTYGINDVIAPNSYGTDDLVHITGCGGIKNSDGSVTLTTECIDKFGTATDYTQSTTGNIYGIFDLVFGGWESYMTLGKTTPTSELLTGYSKDVPSGFNGLYMDGDIENNAFDIPDSKYYDVIIYSENCSNELYIGQTFCHTNYWFTRYIGTHNQGPIVGLVGSNHNMNGKHSQFGTWGSSGFNHDGEGTVRAIIALEK